MAKIKYRDVRLSNTNKIKLDLVNSIISEYQADGYVLTLRQLYYQLVSRDIVPNTPNEYGKLSTLLREGRMGGMVDWEAIEDRMRVPNVPASFQDPNTVLQAAIDQYEKPRMKGQPVYIETWVEKDALSGVLSRVTSKYHVPIMVNRGYSSVSAMHDAYERFYYRGHMKGIPVKILYLGDHDPSGLDIIRDIFDRITEFDWSMEFEVIPIALTMKQIEQYNPPPNPAKLTDSRASDYVAKHGYESWEVDALKPEVLNDILDKAIRNHIDMELFNEILIEEKEDIQRLKSLKKYLK